MSNPFKTQRSLSEVVGVQSSGSPAPERQQSTGRHSEDVPPYTKPETLEAGLTAIEQAGRCSVHEGTHLQQAGCQNWVLMSAIQLTPHSASDKAALVKAERAAELQKKQREDFMLLVGNLDNLDWKNIKPHIMAQILTKIPRKGRKDEPAYYLTLEQALVFAVEAYRMDLSPLSDQCFFVPETWKVNATLSGKKYMARNLGMNFGPPRFERLTKPFERGKTVPGFKEDLGFKCSMEIKGFSDRAEYTAWLSEWYVSTSPVWREKPEHMLQTRAQEKAISSASGVGASEMPHVNDIEPPIVGAPQIEAIDIPSFTQEK